MLENTPNVPALDLPALDIVSAAKGFGCAAVEARTWDTSCVLARVERGRPSSAS